MRTDPAFLPRPRARRGANEEDAAATKGVSAKAGDGEDDWGPGGSLSPPTPAGSKTIERPRSRRQSSSSAVGGGGRRVSIGGIAPSARARRSLGHPAALADADAKLDEVLASIDRARSSRAALERELHAHNTPEYMVLEAGAEALALTRVIAEDAAHAARRVRAAVAPYLNQGSVARAANRAAALSDWLIRVGRETSRARLEDAAAPPHNATHA